MNTKDTTNTTKGSPPMEHERRFFPDLKTFVFEPALHRKKEILQGYLEDGLGTRLRDECNDEGVHTYWKTRKSGEGISREEPEEQLSKETFDLLWEGLSCKLTKTRYFVPWNNVVAEVNIYHGDLAGYIQIEVEFKTHEEAVAFIPPDWFGLEVTDDFRHGNYALTKYGCKDLL